ncbi:hypothetical protein JHN60_20650, partial [Streptomyces sp. MBT51]|nr:hypothetical protein [Streptomyces sp. MBT51]
MGMVFFVVSVVIVVVGITALASGSRGRKKPLAGYGGRGRRRSWGGDAGGTG